MKLWAVRWIYTYPPRTPLQKLKLLSKDNAMILVYLISIISMISGREQKGAPLLSQKLEEHMLST